MREGQTQGTEEGLKRAFVRKCLRDLAGLPEVVNAIKHHRLHRDLSGNEHADIVSAVQWFNEFSNADLSRVGDTKKARDATRKEIRDLVTVVNRLAREMRISGLPLTPEEAERDNVERAPRKQKGRANIQESTTATEPPPYQARESEEPEESYEELKKRFDAALKLHSALHGALDALAKKILGESAGFEDLRGLSFEPENRPADETEKRKKLIESGLEGDIEELDAAASLVDDNFIDPDTKYSKHDMEELLERLERVLHGKKLDDVVARVKKLTERVKGGGLFEGEEVSPEEVAGLRAWLRGRRR